MMPPSQSLAVYAILSSGVTAGTLVKSISWGLPSQSRPGFPERPIFALPRGYGIGKP
jgi:hypothetical protein